LAKSKQKHTAPSQNNDNLKMGVGVAWRLVCRGHGGTLKKYSRQVETENRIYRDLYYCYL